MTAQPTGVTLVREATRIARAVATGRTTREEAEELVALGAKIAHRTSTTWSASQKYRPGWNTPAAINLMNAVGNLAVVSTAGKLCAALEERPGMSPLDYLTSLRLDTLPAWPLPDDAAAVVVVYRRGGTGFSRLWSAIGKGDEAEINRAITKLIDAIHGPSGFWARGLGD
ncbi:hypothetical protein ACFU99_22565 [Streptomyces sp. NPDC057654]|uniref:hypothetical protein n=1 Tax=Streptomyces sp. NPDC057654 TaxID=3346196 RepID=UPI0036A634F4